MLRGHNRLVADQFRRLFGDWTVSAMTESQLLERFLCQRDEVAISALVARHGPMVLAVCRHLLHDPNDVEDAFQATFLVLVRKAKSIRQPELIGPWLYGVAYRVAIRARVQAARRRSREAPGAEEVAVTSNGIEEMESRELRPAIHDEIQRLPDKYRLPIVLCYLEGQTHDEAAARLRWPVGTVRGRLSRARDLLRTRLTRRGVTLSAGLLTTLLAESAANAAVPAALMESTVRAAMIVAAGPAVATGVISASAAALLEGVITTMFWSKLRCASAIVLGVGAVTVSAAVLAGQGPGGADKAANIFLNPQDATPKAAKSEQLKAVGTPKEQEHAEDEEIKIADELDEARVNVEILTIELEQERHNLQMKIQTLKQLESQLADGKVGQFFGGTGGGVFNPKMSKEEEERFHENTLREYEASRQKTQDNITKIRQQYLEDTQKLTREKRRVAKFEKQLFGQDVGSALPQAVERRLSELETKIDKVLRAMEAPQKAGNR